MLQESDIHTGLVELSYVIAVCNHALVMHASAPSFINKKSVISALPIEAAHRLELGYYDGVPCELWLIRSTTQTANLLENIGWDLKNLKTLFALHSHESLNLAMKALQLSHWYWHHQYCGRCGKATFQSAKAPFFMTCETCQAEFYPHISPCVIGLVVRGQECLLAHNLRFRDDTYSTLAGFIEPGESAEEAFKREVWEETGIEVTDLTYFGSQSWPFPSQLMIGFIAQYKAGHIKVDGVEIDKAAWFSRENLPKIPSEHSISGKIIRYFISQNI